MEQGMKREGSWLMKGLVHIYTGDGKGKTTSAIGLGIRAYGRGMRVLMVQFLKGADTGELKTIEKLAPDFKIYRSLEQKTFFWKMTDEQKLQLKESVESTFEYAVNAAKSGEWNMIIMDELMGTLSNGLLDTDIVADFILSRPEGLELVMTGRNPPDKLVELADYVSIINAHKHPFQKGIPARKGIEF